MPDPTTSNILLAIPSRGSDAGAWDTPVNGDFSAIDGMLGGQAVIALAATTTLLLTMPATGTVSASAGPNQSQNHVIKITGTLTGNAVLQVTMPKEYVFDTTGLTVGTSYVQIAPASGTGTRVGLPDGELTKVWFDGTNVSFVGLGRVGSLLDLCVATTPPWVAACTNLPYLLTDGSVYSTSVYPALGNKLGSTFGGNGITTFGVPDTISRLRISLDTASKNRVTSGGSAINGAAIAAAGGNELMQQHTHAATVTDPGHFHGIGADNNLGGAHGQVGVNTPTSFNTNSAVTGISVANATTGSGSSQNMPPAIVFGLTFIKT